MKGVFSLVSQEVKSRKANGDIVLDSSEICKNVMAMLNPADFNINELLEYYVRLLAVVALNNEGCYSINRREKVYINLDRCTDSEELTKILQNKKIDIKGDAKTYLRILQQRRELDGQFHIDFDNPEESYPIESFESLIRKVSSM